MDNEEQPLNFKNLFVPLTTTKAIVFIVITGLIVYFNMLFNGFVWDDFSFIINNPQVHQLNIPLLLGNNMFNNGPFYRPIPAIYFSLVYSFFGQQAFFYHLFQLILHLACTSFLFIFLLKFFDKRLSLFLSLVFLVHPINVESVAYVGSTQSELYFLPGIIALTLIVNQKLALRKFLLVNFLLCLSIFTKETGFLFLFLITSYQFLFKGNRLKEFIASGALIGIIYILFRVMLGKVVYSMDQKTIAIAALSLPQRIVNIPAVFLYYLKTFFYPKTLTIWQNWVINKLSFTNFFIPFLICLSIFVLVVIFGIYVFRKDKKLFSPYVFFIFWYAIGIGLLLHIVPLDMTVADRWFYFPIVGLLGTLGIVIMALRILENKWMVAIIIFILVLLSARTVLRTFDWKTELALASKDSKTQTNVGLENLLSADYFNVGNFEAAKIHAQRSIKFCPFTTNFMNLGASEVYLGNYKAAKEAFLNSIKYGDYYQTYDNLSYLYLLYGDPKENIMFIQGTALKKFPNDPKLWTYLSILEYNFTDKDKAKQDIEHAFTLDPQGQTASVYSAIMNNIPLIIKGRLK